MKKIAVLLVLCCILLTGCGFAGETYRTYITSVLDCTYHAEYKQYQELTGAGLMEAENIYTEEVLALSQYIRDTYGIQSDQISGEMTAGYTELAKKILQKTKYTVRDVTQTENSYTASLVISPVDFWTQSQADVQKYYEKEFMPKYTAAPTRTAADRLEEEYAEHILNILDSHAETIDYEEPVIYTFTIENTSVSADVWQDVDRLILNLN